MIELGSVSEIVSGFNVARLPINERDRRYTNADFEYDFYRMKLADPSNSIIYRQASGASHMAATILSDENKDKFISQVFSIMNVNRERLNPWYLCWLLNESRSLEKQINILLQGTVITRLSAQQLKQIRIELPPLDEQKKIGKLYATALYQYYLETNQAKQKLNGILSVLKKASVK